jgi:hypothetical protein
MERHLVGALVLVLAASCASNQDSSGSDMGTGSGDGSAIADSAAVALAGDTAPLVGGGDVSIDAITLVADMEPVAADAAPALDEGGAPDRAADVATTPDVSAPPRLSAGSWSYRIVAITATMDGCALSPGSLVGAILPVTYVQDTRSLAVGRLSGTPSQPALGQGTLVGVMGTLVRENEATDGSSCRWHQENDAVVTVIGPDRFTMAAREVESMFSGCLSTPAGGSCTSTWTWTLEK